MPLPSYQELMLPLLKVLGAAMSEVHQKKCTDLVSDMLHLTEEQRQVMLQSGGQTVVHNRTSWAGWYLQQAGIVEKTRRAHLRITDVGLKLLAMHPASIDNKFLAATYPGFKAKIFKPSPTTGSQQTDVSAISEQTPTDQIEEAHLKLVQTLASDLLDQMLKMDPYRFEQLVVDLLFAMGYGGSRAEAALVTQKSNDEGIDGVINEDRLGLDVIYVQAKRWQSSVGRKEIQNFVGALAGKHANKGVFITTSAFIANAVDYAKSVQHKIVLIDGQRLAELMIEYNVGVSIVRNIAIKRVDSDYFEE
jgi:restriction system protein